MSKHQKERVFPVGILFFCLIYVSVGYWINMYTYICKIRRLFNMLCQELMLEGYVVNEASYGIMMAEECIEEMNKTAAGAALGAATGAAVGVGASAAGWAARRIALRNKMKACDNLGSLDAVKQCKEKIKDQIKKLSKRTLKRGAANATIGAVGGAAVGGMGTKTANVRGVANKKIGKSLTVAAGLATADAKMIAGSIDRNATRKERSKEESLAVDDFGIMFSEQVIQEIIGAAMGAGSGHIASKQNELRLAKLRKAKAACGADKKCAARYNEMIKQTKSKIADKGSSMTKRAIGGAFTGTIGVGIHHAIDSSKKKKQMRNILDKLKYQQTQCKDDACRNKYQKQIGAMNDKYANVTDK